MKTTLDGTQLWSIEEIAKSNLHTLDTFTVTVGSIRDFYNRYMKLKIELQNEKLKTASLEEKINSQNRFVVFA